MWALLSSVPLIIFTSEHADSSSTYISTYMLQKTNNSDIFSHENPKVSL
jgi:hypothetical protein